MLCALAASIKVPAAIGIVYVAWDWAGPFADWRRRARMLVRAGLITVAVMGVLSLVSGLGWGWIANLGTPGTVRSWMAPATGFGLLISGTAHLVGIGVGLGGVLTLTRAIGLIAAAAIAVYCLRNRERIGMLGALGATMMAFVLLGPVVQPWYLTWGIIIVAPVVTGRWLYAVLGLSTVAPFIGLTGGRRPAERTGAHGPGQHGPGRHGALGRGHRPAGELDDLVAARPLAAAGPAGHQRRARVLSRPG